MSKFGYKLRNAFKSKEELEIEAKMQFERDRRSFLEARGRSASGAVSPSSMGKHQSP